MKTCPKALTIRGLEIGASNLRPMSCRLDEGRGGGKETMGTGLEMRVLRNQLLETYKSKRQFLMGSSIVKREEKGAYAITRWFNGIDIQFGKKNNTSLPLKSLNLSPKPN